jgi:hypothetical protein
VSSALERHLRSEEKWPLPVIPGPKLELCRPGADATCDGPSPIAPDGEGPASAPARILSGGSVHDHDMAFHWTTVKLVATSGMQSFTGLFVPRAMPSIMTAHVCATWKSWIVADDCAERLRCAFLRCSGVLGTVTLSGQNNNHSPSPGENCAPKLPPRLRPTSDLKSDDELQVRPSSIHSLAPLL